MKTDNQIQKDIMDQIKWNPFLNAAEIGVSVKRGIVTLSDHVDSFIKKTEVEKAVKKVSRVKAIAEDISVGVSANNKKTESEIATAVATALKWRSAVKDETIKIKVKTVLLHLSVMLTGHSKKKCKCRHRAFYWCSNGI